jgi:sulfatase maturation enzyme AslB (radical SAM superfamily)
LYFRPMYLDGEVFAMTEEIKALIDQLSQEYAQPARYNLNRYRERNYTRCHQMFQFPVFCADGHVYSCCENKGNPYFRIGTWTDGDFRDAWLDERHWEVYNSINTKLCHQCRSNGDNIEIQNILDNPQLIEKLYL